MIGILISAHSVSADVLHSGGTHCDGDRSINLRYRYEVDDIMELKSLNLRIFRKTHPKLNVSAILAMEAKNGLSEEEVTKIVREFFHNPQMKLREFKRKSQRVDFVHILGEFKTEQDTIEIDRVIPFTEVSYWSMADQSLKFLLVTDCGKVVLPEVSKSVNGSPYKIISAPKTPK